jgi:hypothetical protein
MSKRQDPFRTLDDPEPALADRPDCSVRADQISAGTLTAPAGSLVGITAPAAPGYWVLPALRPSWLRRFAVWVLLGWKWHS